jgi:hypothetical protein
MFKGSIGDEVLGELIETGSAATQQLKQISPKAVAKTAAEQITGKPAAQANSLPPGLEDLKDKKLPPDKLKQLQQQDAHKSQADLDATRLNLKQLKTHRYQEIQQEVGRAEQDREQQELVKERQEIAAAQEKTQKAQAEAGPVRPPGHKSSKELNRFEKAMTGSKEQKATKLMG